MVPLLINKNNKDKPLNSKEKKELAIDTTHEPP
jgi:hypothetical protein